MRRVCRLPLYLSYAAGGREGENARLQGSDAAEYDAVEPEAGERLGRVIGVDARQGGCEGRRQELSGCHLYRSHLRIRVY